MAERKGLGDKKNRHDPVYLKAKQENFAGRAIYKLEELDKRFRLIKPGMRILDLGCWPGSWLQYAVGKTGLDSVLVGVDLEPVAIALPSNVQTFVGEVAFAQGHHVGNRAGLEAPVALKPHFDGFGLCPDGGADERGQAAERQGAAAR